MERAARIAVRETKKFLQDNPLVERVLLVCFGQDACGIYSRALAEALRK
jgi:O-acetyl-ADP-ribose deacetylase (regulator of RNase III)